MATNSRRKTDGIEMLIVTLCHVCLVGDNVSSFGSDLSLDAPEWPPNDCCVGRTIEQNIVHSEGKVCASCRVTSKIRKIAGRYPDVTPAYSMLSHENA